MYKLAIIGFGAIARRQHLPSIAANPSFELKAVLDRADNLQADVIVYRDLDALIESDIDAVVLCTPPRPRYDIALRAIAAGKHVMLEKPPAASFGAATSLASAAAAAGVTLFATWHSQYNRAVDAARGILAGDPPKRIDVTWSEDVSVHHQGQEWVWEPGGFGVFDAGINALSILTRILPEKLLIEGGHLLLGPGDQTPIRADIVATSGRCEAHLVFDWQVKTDCREITIHTRSGRLLHMPASGRHLLVDGVAMIEEGRMEYQRMYARFAELLDGNTSDVDLEPLRVVTDALACLPRKAMINRAI